jgi:hypothetical protein
MNFAAFTSYISRPEWAKDEPVANLQAGIDYTDEEWQRAFPLSRRLLAVATSLGWGLFLNPPFWVATAAFSVIMRTVAGTGLFFNGLMYVIANVISYMAATWLPLKSFSSDGDGPMRPLGAGLQNGWRMFLPLLLAQMSTGHVGLYPLVGTLVAMIVEGGKHALMHANGGYVFENITFLTDTLERRIAVTGLALPANVRVTQFFTRDPPVYAYEPELEIGQGVPAPVVQPVVTKEI